MKHFSMAFLAISLLASQSLSGSTLSQAFERIEQGMHQMIDEMNNLFYSYATPMQQHKRSLTIKEDKKIVTLSINAPNLEKDDIKAERTRNGVTISVEKPELNLHVTINQHRVDYTIKEEIIQEERDDEDNVVSRHSSISHQSYTQSLPSEVSLDDISVHYEDGILSMRLPKKELEPDTTRIPVTMK